MYYKLLLITNYTIDCLQLDKETYNYIFSYNSIIRTQRKYTKILKL